MFTSWTLKLSIVFTGLMTIAVLVQIWFQAIENDLFWRTFFSYVVMVIGGNAIGKMLDVLFKQEDRLESRAKDTKKVTKKTAQK